ncbi:unnamed protein product [Rotaria magnacalcarata]|uniref:Transposase n=1 Tax=Rotaria magnacalcarata TaxID=392030 RepID=A0A817AEZ0_9BILA|nr:unnamed protein product [Rotaria magnacalcarata]
MNKEQIRAYIKVRTALNMQPKSIFDDLCTALRDQAPSYNTVVRWSKLCRDGREEVEDEPRPDRPVTETTSDNIEKARHLIDNDPYLTIDETQTTDPVLIHHVERGQTIDHDYYINNCLQPLVNEIKKQRPSSGTHAIKIHHDNARPHAHKDVSTYLESQGIMKMLQPPNSPNLAPCDFWLFDLIKENLTNQRSSVSLHRAVTKVMFSINDDSEQLDDELRNNLKVYRTA